jgi:predicted CopG family antitoxin
MSRIVRLSDEVYERLVALRGIRTRGRCNTLSDVLAQYLPLDDEGFVIKGSPDEYEDDCEEDDDEDEGYDDE